MFGLTLAANYCLWPAAHLVNFGLVPSDQRILYVNAHARCTLKGRPPLPQQGCLLARLNRVLQPSEEGGVAGGWGLLHALLPEWPGCWLQGTSGGPPTGTEAQMCSAYAQHEEYVEKWLGGWMAEQWQGMTAGLEEKLQMNRRMRACEVELLEWLDDVDLLESHSWGARINYAIAGPLLAHMRSALQSAADSKHIKKPAHLLFAHCETLVPLATLLGLFKPELALPPSAAHPPNSSALAVVAPEAEARRLLSRADVVSDIGLQLRPQAALASGPAPQSCHKTGQPPSGLQPPGGWYPCTPFNATRLFKGSRVSPYAANLAVVLYRAVGGVHGRASDHTVRLVYNEQVVPIPGCGDGEGGLDCNLDQFLAITAAQADEGVLNPPVLGTPLELNGPYSSTDNPVFDAAAPPQEPAPAPTRSSRAVQPMALVTMAVPELIGTSRLAFRAFSLKLRAYLGLNLHIPVNAFHHLLASSAMDGVFFQSITDAYEQLVDGWGDEADRAEALEALLDLVEEQLIDPPSHQAGLDPALVLGGKGCSSAKAFATAFESAVNEAIRRGTLTHFTAINHLFSHCLQVPTMRQEQRTKLRDEAVRLFHQAVPDAEDRQDQRAFRAALHAVSAAHENLLDSMRYVPATADRPPLRAEQDLVSEEVLLLRQQLAELQAWALPQPPQRERARQPVPQPLQQPMPHHLQQPMQEMGYPMPHPVMQQPLPSLPMSQAYAAPPMQLDYAAMPQPALRSAPMQHAPMQTQRSRPAKTCPLHPYAGHDLAECRQFQAMPPHEQQRVIGGSAPRAAHAVAAHTAGSVVSRAITDPRQRTPLLDRGYVPAAPAHAQHTCSYCHKRYHPPERCFKLYPHLQAAPPPSLSGPARAHTVSAEGSGLGAWDMSGHWVSLDARVQPLSYPEHGSFCIITANAARAVPFTPMSAALPAGATHTLPKAAAPAPPAAPATTPTMGSVFATQPGLQELAVQLQHLAQRVTRIEQHLSPSVAPVDTAAHIAAEPPRAAAVRAACHTAVPNQHLTYFSNVTVQSGCAVADSEGQLHLLQGVMLDGGSDSCLISHECAAALNLPLTPCSRRLSTASGAEALATQVATLRVSLSYGTPHAMVHDLEAIVMPPGSPLAYDLLLGANFLSQTKGVCDVYDRQFSYCPRLHSHGDIRTSHSLPVTGPKGCLPLLYSAPMGSSQLLVACTAVSHSQVQPCATSGTASAMIHTPGVHLHVGTPPVAAGTTTPSAVSRGGDLATTEGARSGVATDDAPIPAGSGVKSVRSSAQPATRRGGGTASQSVLSSARDPAARRTSQTSSASQRSAKHLAVGTAAAQHVAKQQRSSAPTLPPPSPLLPRRSSREVVWHTLTPLRLFLSFLFLLWLPAIVTSLPPPIPDLPTSAIACSVISMVLPDGPAAAHSPEQYTQLPNGVPNGVTSKKGTTREPNIQERELALGYVVGTTAAPGLTTADRHQITGHCMDATAAESLYAVAAALHHASLLHAHAHSCLSSSSLSHALVVAAGGGAQLLPSSHTSTTQHCSPSTAPDPALPTATAAQPAVTLAHLADVATPNVTYTITHPQCSGFSITPQELRVASTVINLDLMHSLLDPCTTTPIIISGLELQPLSAQLHLSLSPAAYRALLQQQPIDAIISSPDPAVLDLLLPLAVIYAHSLVCMLVPHAYLSDAPPARFRWIQQLKQAERLLHVTCPSLGSGMGWVMVFSSKAQKRHLLKLPVMGAYLKL
ncbi:hypothetical protein QJQ45_008243 [Haematococcus lacustris]|nr:hypothetical protein QJQ45_008243 [Haematococcus lacustris]